MDASKAGSTALSDRLGSSDNAIGFVRLVLALLVILGHGFPLGGFSSPVFSGIHGSAVNGFFVISGYLILASALRTRPIAYLWRRFLRIYPGYLVALLATAFVFPWIASRIESGASFDLHSAITYVTGALDLKSSQDGVGHTLFSVPHPGVWNASLWTLWYEFMAYLMTLVLVVIPPIRKRLGWVVGGLVVLGAVLYLFKGLDGWFAVLPGAGPVLAANIVRLWTFFGLGMLARVFSDRILVSRGWVIAAAIAWVGLTQLGLPVPAGARTLVELVLLPVAVLGAGALLPTRIGSRRDLSYGLYVYACPVQQLLIIMGITRYGWLATVGACIVCTLPIALASWQFIERPALSLKRLVPAVKAA